MYVKFWIILLFVINAAKLWIISYLANKIITFLSKKTSFYKQKQRKDVDMTDYN